MAQRGNNFFHMVLAGLALAPQAITGSTVDGETISEPWTYGRQITFLVSCGVLPVGVQGNCMVYGQRRDTGAWEVLYGNDGVTALEFPITLFAPGGGADAATVIGTLDVSYISGETYKAIRVSFTENFGTASIDVGVAYVINDLTEKPSGQVDYLFSQQRPA